MIVGVGELLWDVFPDGRKVAGGAPFNFAFHCHNLGHEAAVVSRVGDDDLGRELRAEVRRLGLSDEFIQTDPKHPTGTVRVTVDAAGQPSYEIVQNVAWDHIGWTPELEQLGTTAKAIGFGTLAMRSDSEASVRELVLKSQTRNSQALVVYDINLRADFYQPSQIEWGLWVSNWRKLNDSEMAVLSGMFNWRWTSDAEVLNATLCQDRRDSRVAILTKGADGLTVYHRWEVDDPGEGSSYFAENLIAEPGIPAAVVDTVGAGDSFTAAMVCLHLEGRSLKDCARFASHYAARVCEHRGGTPPIDRAEVERAAFG
ncbi:MAG: carbohydrate kinase [Gemmataceae bacterium]